MFRSRLPATRQGAVAAAFLVSALVFGGGGSPTAAAEIIVQLSFVAAFLGWVFWARGPLDIALQPRALAAIAVLVLALALVQMVPLPPVLWQALPGRGLEARALGLVGEADSWRPLSVAPSATLAALLAMIPPVGMMLCMGFLGLRDRRALLLLVGLVGIGGAMLGAAQMAGPGDAFQLYELSHRGWVTGFFANRNSAADAFLIASMALGAWWATQPTNLPHSAGSRVAMVAAQALLLVALVLTGSRAGLALLPVAIAVHALLLGDARKGKAARRLGIAAAALAGIAALIPLLVAVVPRLGSVARRFAFNGDFRTELWTDTAFAIQRYWPVGSGLGTFVHAFLPVERLEVVDATYPNRAHNDYLELLLETGILGAIVLSVVAVLVVRLFRRGWADSMVPRPFLIFAAGSLAVTALHSVVDYPLRTMALATLCALSVGLCTPRFGGTPGAGVTGQRE